MLRKILLLFIFFFSMVSMAKASEYLGKISTDPASFIIATTSQQNIGTAKDNRNDDNDPKSKTSVSSGNFLLNSKNPEITKDTTSQASKSGAKVLSSRIYPDGTLLRDSGKRIYLIAGNYKKKLHDPAELKKYPGHPIYNVSDDILDAYIERSHVEGELIRQIGTARVYVIRKDSKFHILNLKILREQYFGLEIYNLDPEEMKKY